MQSHMRRRPDAQDLLRAYKLRFGDRDVPGSDEALEGDQIVTRLSHDERLAAMPDNFDVYETNAHRDERIRRTRDGLAVLLHGDPNEHQESWEILKESLVDARSAGAATSTP